MKDIKRYEGRYAVTEDGKVWSYPKPRSSKNGKWLKPIPIIKKRNKGTEYISLSVNLSRDNKRKSFLVHRLVAEAFTPNTENKPQVNHKDGNSLNNNVGNLEWVDFFGNMQHAQKNGLLNQFTEAQIIARSANGKLTGKINGAKAHRKFNKSDVNKIKSLWKTTGRSFASIGREYGVSPKTISNVCYNKTYQFDLEEKL